MTQYLTGELAKLCSISTRTLQYYDKKDLLNRPISKIIVTEFILIMKLND
ncbi:hypothetical protein N039_03325 [Staphylococcus sp. EGD-HP3]|nr:hypothetical protein N039_03325 [Staphylococcus sp. EGD-HP3]